MYRRKYLGYNESVIGIYLLVFVYGSVIGSFLNVVIDRLPEGKSIVFGHSSCDYCQKPLRWYELIPVLSFLLQKGRCRRCDGKLSVQYPAVELLTGLLTTIIVWRHFPTLLIDELTLSAIGMIIVQLIFVYSLIVVTIVDFKLGIIPDEIIIFLTGVFGITSITRILYSIIAVESLTAVAGNIAISLLSGLIAGGVFFFIVLITKGKGMGGGDVKLAWIIGLFLSGVSTLLSLYIAFVTGAVVAIILLIIGRRRFGQTIPFGPFMALGAVTILLFGDQIQTLYLTLFGLI